MITLAVIIHSFKQRDPTILWFCCLSSFGDVILSLPVVLTFKVLNENHM
jgi:hypothetical protein